MSNTVELLAMFGAAFVLSLGLMTIAWFVYLFQRKANVVDVAWPAAFLATAWAYLIIGDGDALKRWAITLMVTVWAVRLGKHLFDRFLAFPEDPRYVDLRRSWNGDKSNFLFLMMFLFQGTLVVILSLPFFIVSYASTPVWKGWEVFGFLIWALGLAGEALADRQLANFRSDLSNRGKVCREGLWYYSRHPNYFFEWVVWIGFFLFAFSSPGGWFAIISPVLMFALLTQVSGVPLNEAQALDTKGDDYREYQRTTQPFFPWFPLKDKEKSEGEQS